MSAGRPSSSDRQPGMTRSWATHTSSASRPSSSRGAAHRRHRLGGDPRLVTVSDRDWWLLLGRDRSEGRRVSENWCLPGVWWCTVGAAGTRPAAPARSGASIGDGVVGMVSDEVTATRVSPGLVRMGVRWLVALAACLVVVGVLAAPALAAGSWATTGSLATAREDATATLLQNGDVLVVGGQAAGSLLASAELYDPATGTWSATGSMSTARGAQTATLLPDGEVLVAGGFQLSADGFSFTVLASAELYDPATGTWSATASMSEGRAGATATLLQNGKVLVTGGTGPFSPWRARSCMTRRPGPGARPGR